MPTSPGRQLIAPDTPSPQDPIHHPQKPDHPFHDEREDEGFETEADEDTGSDPWWMQGDQLHRQEIPFVSTVPPNRLAENERLETEGHANFSRDG